MDEDLASFGCLNELEGLFEVRRNLFSLVILHRNLQVCESCRRKLVRQLISDIEDVRDVEALENCEVSCLSYMLSYVLSIT